MSTDSVRTIRPFTRSSRRGVQATAENLSSVQPSPWSPPTMAMFNECSNMTINGGIFTMVQATEHQEDFRTIRVGDINLISLVNEGDVLESRIMVHRKRPARVHRREVCVGVRKVYHAKIFGSQDIFTVMVYERDLNEWKRKSVGETPRHLNHIQLFGITNSPRMYATVYHDELIPAREAVRQCPTLLSSRLLSYALTVQFLSFEHYLRDTVTNVGMEPLHHRAEWFRTSTGQLCVEMDHLDSQSWFDQAGGADVDPSLGSLQVIHPLQGCLSDKALLAKISLPNLLRILSCRLVDSRAITPYHGPVQLATVYTVDMFSELGDFVGSSKKTCSLPSSSKLTHFNYGLARGGNWKRFQYDEIQQGLKYSADEGFRLIFARPYLKDKVNIARSWLGNVNSISLLTSGKAEKHFLASGCSFSVHFPMDWDPFQLAGTFMTHAPTTTDIYMFFLVPEPYTTAGNEVWINIPSFREACFWSLDADGNQRLSDEDCLRLGLPEYTFEAEVTGMMWREEDYKIIRDFRVIHDLEMFNEDRSCVSWHDGSVLVDSLQIDAESRVHDYGVKFPHRAYPKHFV
ncbi:hypothetical protein C8F01DRAFT_1177657 [Mycena amicta]|nr:hypothetical protein C8F01DRAFT_1177657 [Mycena amicta]